jgi:Endonuclease/Exonuclease/phosphatase family
LGTKLLTAAAVSAVALISAVPAHAARKDPVDVKVMTRNIFLGGDILKPVSAPDRAGFEQGATELWQEVQSTDFPSRAPLLAKEIDQQEPDLIGLQEVALWRRGPDGVKDGPSTPATTVVYDFLKLLQAQLKKRGLDYRAVKVQQEMDIEASTSLGYDVRLTMRDVILAKKGVKTSKARGGNYKERLPVPVPAVGVTYNVIRGWTSVEANVDGAKFRFVNTHLEAFGHPTRTAQAKELVKRGGPANSGRLPIVLVGDMNSDDSYKDDQRNAFLELTRAGFKDSGPKTQNCCYDDLFKGLPKFDHKVDQILTKPRVRPVDTGITGNDKRNRAKSGLFPSDHGGAWSVLRFRP